MGLVEQFNGYRTKMNYKIMGAENLIINIPGKAYGFWEELQNV